MKFTSPLDTEVKWKVVEEITKKSLGNIRKIIKKLKETQLWVAVVLIVDLCLLNQHFLSLCMEGLVYPH